MKKHIKINYSHIKAEYLIQFFEDGLLKKWEIVNSSTDIPKLIQEFYFP